MSYTNGLDDPTLYFNTILWTGDGTGNRSLTGVGFKPDWVWTKLRSTAGSHQVYDIVRGATKDLETDNTNAESTTNGDGYLNSFDSDGFTMNDGADSDFYSNDTGKTYVAWNWLAGGSPSSNTDGSITSSVSANTTAGFSIVSYTGTGANATVGHGLGSDCKLMIIKNRTDSSNWIMYHQKTAENRYMVLNATNAEAINFDYWQSTKPTSSVFSIGTANTVNGSSDNMIAYCFAEKKGYSKFGSYTGNGNADGTFIYTGFKPALIIMKRSDSAGNNWRIFDNKRSTSSSNVTDKALRPNTSNAEFSSNIDFVSNGVKIRNTDGEANTSGGTYIYMCFASSPFTTSTGIPTTAR